MSFASRMLIKRLQVSGMKGKLARGSQKTFEEAVSYNRKHPFVMPEDHKAIYEQINIRTGFGMPSYMLLIVFWLPMMIIQFNAFSKGLTPYPRKARWFCVLIGMIPAMVLSAIFGPHSALGSAIGTMFLCFGNAFLFGGLLATLPEQEVFEAFESSLHQSSEGNRSNSFPHFFG